MPRKPKAKDGLTAGQRAALYEARQAEKIAKMSGAENAVSLKQEQADKVAARSLDGSDPPKAEKVLPKPQHATVRVDFSLDIGEIKPMHGMCNGPVSYGADISELFREIGVPRVRFSGTDTPVSSLAIDISRIFKLIIDNGADLNYIKPNGTGKTYTEDYGAETLGMFLK